MINGSLYNLAKLKKTKHSTEIFLKQRDPTDRAVTHMKLFGRFLNCPRYVGFNENLILSAWIEITTCSTNHRALHLYEFDALHATRV